MYGLNFTQLAGCFCCCLCHFVHFLLLLCVNMLLMPWVGRRVQKLRGVGVLLNQVGSASVPMCGRRWGRAPRAAGRQVVPRDNSLPPGSRSKYHRSCRRSGSGSGSRCRRSCTRKQSAFFYVVLSDQLWMLPTSFKIFIHSSFIYILLSHT